MFNLIIFLAVLIIVTIIVNAVLPLLQAWEDKKHYRPWEDE